LIFVFVPNYQFGPWLY